MRMHVWFEARLVHVFMLVYWSRDGTVRVLQTVWLLLSEALLRNEFKF